MKMVQAVKSGGSESPSRFSLKEKLENLQFLSVDRNNRWPVQGWSSGSSGDETNSEIHEQLLAEECTRQFVLDQETRWPLQGWCKAHNGYKRESDASTIKPSVASRWPQGW